MNLFKQADGNIQALVNNRPFLSGEMFVQIIDVEDSTKYKDNTNLQFVDAVTNAEIGQFFKGDLYGGCGYGVANPRSDGKIPIYQLGSGNALKLAPVNPLIQFWDKTSREVIKAHPNCLYLYIGDPQVSRTSPETKGTAAFDSAEASTNTFPGYEKVAAAEGIEAHKKVNLGDAGREVTTNQLSDDLNTGDMVFYSPIYKTYMVWHLSRTTTNLVRMLTANLTSKSLKRQLGLINADGTVNTDAKADLSTFLNKVARDYQSLDNTEGWVKLDYTATASNTAGDFSIPEGVKDKDGAIYYVPFSVTLEEEVEKEDGSKVKENVNKLLNFAGNYRFKCGTEETLTGLLPGDVVISLPVYSEDYSEINDTNVNLGVKHVIVSLYGEYLSRNDVTQLEIVRADEYADYRHTSADEKLEAALKKGDAGLKELLENIYSTKVDIDPTTKKVVTSQLPAFVLGGLKLVGSTNYAELSKYDSGEGTDPVTMTPATMFVAQRIADKWNVKLGLVDENGNAKEGVTLITPFDFDANGEALKDSSFTEEHWKEIYEEFESAVGSYFIWGGDPTYIDTNSSTDNTNKVAPNTLDTSYAEASDGKWYLKEDLTEVKELEVLPGFEREAETDETGLYRVDDVSEIDEDLLGKLIEKYGTNDDGEFVQSHVDAKYATTEVTKIVAKDGAVGFDEQPYLKAVKLDHLSSKYFSESALKGNDDAANYDEDVSVMLNAGDFLIYNGETFDIIDNSSSISGILFNGKLMTGTPGIKTVRRGGTQYYVSNGVNMSREFENLDELEIKRNEDFLEFTATNSILLRNKNGGKDVDVDMNHIPLIDPASRLVCNSSFLIESGVDEKRTVLKPDVKYTASPAKFVAAIDFTQGNSDYDQVFKSNILADTSCNKSDSPTDTHIYISKAGADTQLSVPTYGGVLTTEGYVQSMGEHLFHIMQEEIKFNTSGTIDWLQTIVKNPTEGKANYIDDSAFFQQHSTSESGVKTSSLGVQVGGRNKKVTPALSKITARDDVAADYTDGHKGTTVQPTWQTKLSEDKDGVLSGIPTKLEEGNEVILPNHGGILLTTDSVIDCGTWL